MGLTTTLYSTEQRNDNKYILTVIVRFHGD